MNVFELMAVLSIDSSGFLKGLGSAEKGALQFGSVAMSAVTSVAGVVMDGMGQAADAMMDFTKQSVETGMDFDKAMSQVAATMGITVEDLDKEVGSADTSFGHFEGTLRDFAKYMGSNTVFSATQAAEALNYMALAGYDTQQSMDMLPSVLSLAAAGNMDLATASDMVTDAQTALGLSAEETMQMVDQMAKTASTTNTSVSQLGDAMLTIGGTARFMSGGTDELNSVLGILADNGIKASEAGTHLRNMILKLSSPTDQGAAVMEELGLSVYDAEGRMRSFEDIFLDLGDAMQKANYTDEQVVQAFTDLFNARDVAAATALMNTDAERWGDVKGAIEGASGAAAQMADTQLDNLSGDITLFKSALEGVQIILADQLMPTIREVVQLGTGALQAFTDGFNENGIEGGISNLIDYIGDKFSVVGEKIIEMVPNIIKSAVQLMSKIVPEMIDLFNNDIMPMLFEIIPPLIGEYITALPEMIQQSFDMYAQWIPMIIDLAVQLLVAFANAYEEMMPIIQPLTIELLMIIVNTLLKNLPLILDAAVALIMGMVEGIISMIPAIVSAVVQIIAQMVATIIELVPHLIQAAVHIITEFLTTIVTTALKFFTGDYWHSMLDGIIKSFTDIDWEGLGKMFSEGIANGVKNGWTTIKNAVTNVAEGIKNLFKDIFNIASPSKLFKYYGEMLDEGLAVGIENKDDMPENAINDMSDGVDDAFNLSDSLSRIGSNASRSSVSNLALAGEGVGDIVIPVYIGDEMLDTVIVKAVDRANYRSGGR